MEGIFDLRQRQLRHTFLAHDAPVKSIVVDENEEFFISGSEDGDIKVLSKLTIPRKTIDKMDFACLVVKYGLVAINLREFVLLGGKL